MTTTQQQTTEAMVKALAITLRDKLIEDARHSMKAARTIERQYGLPPSDAMMKSDKR